MSSYETEHDGTCIHCGGPAMREENHAMADYYGMKYKYRSIVKELVGRIKTAMVVSAGLDSKNYYLIKRSDWDGIVQYTNGQGDSK